MEQIRFLDKQELLELQQDQFTDSFRRRAAVAAIAGADSIFCNGRYNTEFAIVHLLLLLAICCLSVVGAACC